MYSVGEPGKFNYGTKQPQGHILWKYNTSNTISPGSLLSALLVAKCVTILQVCLGKVKDINVEAFVTGFGASGSTDQGQKRKSATLPKNIIVQFFWLLSYFTEPRYNFRTKQVKILRSPTAGFCFNRRQISTKKRTAYIVHCKFFISFSQRWK